MHTCSVQALGNKAHALLEWLAQLRLGEGYCARCCALRKLWGCTVHAVLERLLAQVNLGEKLVCRLHCASPG